MNITVLTATKFVVGNIVAIGAGKIVKEIITNNIDDPETVINKVTVYAGAAVLGMIAKDATQDHIEKKIDRAMNFVEKINSKIQEKKTQLAEEVSVPQDSDPT